MEFSGSGAPHDIELKKYTTTELPTKFQESVIAELAIYVFLHTAAHGNEQKSSYEMSGTHAGNHTSTSTLKPEITQVAPPVIKKDHTPTLADFLRAQSSSPDKQERI